MFSDEKSFFVIRKDGMVHPVEIISDGRTVSKLVLFPALAQTTIPSVAKQLVGGMLFVGSAVGPSVLLRAVRVEEEVEEGEAEDTSAAPSAVVDTRNAMDIDDFDDDGERTAERVRKWIINTRIVRKIYMENRS